METHAKTDKEILTNKRTPDIDIHKMIAWRLNDTHVRLEDNPSYKIAMGKIDDYLGDNECNVILDSIDTLLVVAERTAYLQGLYDGLSHSLECA